MIKFSSLVRILCLSLYIPALLIGCGTSTAKTDNSSPKISVIADESAEWQTYSLEDLGENNIYELTYGGLSDVKITINSVSIPLVQAIQEGSITMETLIASIRVDAGSGRCEQSYNSKNGLATYLYSYSQYEVRVIHDIYETPDGKQHPIQSVGFYAPGTSEGLFTIYPDPDSEYGYMLDREDWGLDFTVSESTPTSLTLSCRQKGGQQIGALQTKFYTLLDGQSNIITGKNGATGGICEPIALSQDSETVVTVSWESSHGFLPSGSYVLKLEIEDIYEKSKISPLTRNFYDRQPYYIHFDIP